MKGCEQAGHLLSTSPVDQCGHSAGTFVLLLVNRKENGVRVSISHSPPFLCFFPPTWWGVD